MNLLNRMGIPCRDRTSNDPPTRTALGKSDLVGAAGEFNNGCGAHDAYLKKLERRILKIEVIYAPVYDTLYCCVEYWYECVESTATNLKWQWLCDRQLRAESVPAESVLRRK